MKYQQCTQELTWKVRHLWLQAGVRGDAQGAMAIFSRCNSSWLLAHIPPVLQSTPQGAKALQAELPELGTTQVSFDCRLQAAACLCWWWKQDHAINRGSTN